ncbi:MAG: hypothetical protein LBS49_06965 [Candidatus Accumulibacter sp.]|jgi:hypothetical protein|nr:hypothetical protein [Accumulibacter sp.]
MVYKSVITFLAFACLGLTGCAARYADVPAPTRFPNEGQQKLQAARHWQLIADHFAGQLVNTLGSSLGGRALYVPQPGGEQAFVQGFRELLITSLVAKGVPVAVEASGALTADVRYNIYAFDPDRLKDTYYYGEATMLAANLWALGGALHGIISANNATGVVVGSSLVTAAAWADGMGWLANEGLGKGRFASGPVPSSEILLTVSVADGGLIVSRYSSIYYTADEDSRLYWERSGGTNMPVVGDCDPGRTLCAP